MTDESKTDKAKKMDNLELNKETLQDLTEGEADGARGGGTTAANILCLSQTCLTYCALRDCNATAVCQVKP